MAIGTTAIGVFRTYGEAERAVHDLRRVGFSDDRIGLMRRDTDGRVSGVESDDTKATEGAGVGAAGGGAVGGALGALAAGLIPGIGPVIAVGALAGILGGAAAGAAAGGIVGSLVGLGVPEDDARFYEGEVRSGRTLVTVDAENRYDEAVSVLRAAGSYDAHTQPPDDGSIRDEPRT
jgi:hypothetical protein